MASPGAALKRNPAQRNSRRGFLQTKPSQKPGQSRGLVSNCFPCQELGRFYPLLLDEGFGEMAEAAVSDVDGGLGHVVTSGL